MPTRRDFLSASASLALAMASSRDAAFAAERGDGPPDWDDGQLAHILPTVSHERMLIKASFKQPLAGAPVLRVGAQRVAGQRTDSRGAFWQFDASGLKPATRYALSLTDIDGRAVCAPWTLSTFPAPDAKPQRLRVLIYTCAGGHDALTPIDGKTRYLPAAVRRRLLRRALSFGPDALIANGDHVYWDQKAPLASPRTGASKEAIAYAGQFDSKQPVLGTANERFLQRAAGPQIVPLYGTLCRSLPVFFIQDDHDYFDNDEATDQIITFPPRHWMLDLARATRHLYYPEHLPDPNRPLGLPGASAADRPRGVGEIFGTLRYGQLAEILMYDVRRTMTLAGPSAVFIDRDAEDWLTGRMAARDVTHVVNLPSNPPGWSAGKWGEWYPDILGDDGKLTTAKPKPYWQSGWLAQHDRILGAMAAMPGRIPLVVSGDLHAIGEGRILRSGALDFAHNPVVAVLSGPMGTGDIGWPSAFRGIGAMPPTHLTVEENLKPLENNGFMIADFTPDDITLQFFKWDAHRDPEDVIDRLQPFRITRLARPA